MLNIFTPTWFEIHTALRFSSEQWLIQSACQWKCPRVAVLVCCSRAATQLTCFYLFTLPTPARPLLPEQTLGPGSLHTAWHSLISGQHCPLVFTLKHAWNILPVACAWIQLTKSNKQIQIQLHISSKPLLLWKRLVLFIQGCIFKRPCSNASNWLNIRQVTLEILVLLTTRATQTCEVSIKAQGAWCSCSTVQQLQRWWHLVPTFIHVDQHLRSGRPPIHLSHRVLNTSPLSEWFFNAFLQLLFWESRTSFQFADASMMFVGCLVWVMALFWSPYNKKPIH